MLESIQLNLAGKAQNATESLVSTSEACDCGAACLASVICYHGGRAGLDHMRIISETSAKGSTMLGLYNAAKYVHLKPAAYKTDLKHLRLLENPAILRLKREGGKQTFNVCYGSEYGKFVIGDPMAGVRVYSAKRLLREWPSGVLLSLTPESVFREVMAGETGASANRGSTGSSRYRTFDLSVIPFGADHVLVRSKTSNSVQILPAGFGRSLSLLDRFDTLEAHASRLVEAGIGVSGCHGTEEDHARDREILESQLAQFVRQGILIGEDDLSSEVRCIGENGGTDHGAISGIQARVVHSEGGLASARM